MTVGYRPRSYAEMEEFFWAKVDDSGGPEVCWPWLGCINKGRQAKFTTVHLPGEQIASRVAWILVFGPIPPGLQVHHHCDDPSCVNPFRCLWLGTQPENIADMIAKGRDAPYGWKSGNAKPYRGGRNLTGAPRDNHGRLLPQTRSRA